MKRILLVPVIFLSLLFISCDEVYDPFDDRAPAPPRNVESVTGDNLVDIYWDESSERDVEGYRVYYSFDNKEFTAINKKWDLIRNNSYTDYEAHNGELIYYAVTAVDYNGNESDLSREVVYSTPRPEGFNYSLHNIDSNPDFAGFDFSSEKTVKFEEGDFFFEIEEGKPYLDVWEDSDIQDMGATNSIHDIRVSPLSGWSSNTVTINGFKAKYVEAKEKHTYVINTWDNHYAKVRIVRITDGRVFYDWAYQSAPRNMDLEKKNRSINNIGTQLIKVR